MCPVGGEALVVAPHESDFVGLSPDSKTVGLLTKKMLDEVRYESSAYPWRRAPVWLAFKGFLHVMIVRESTNDVLYKTFVEKFLAFVLEKVAADPHASTTAEAHVSLSCLMERLP